MAFLSFILPALIAYFLNFNTVDCGSPLLISGSCQHGLFYYQHYAVYKCIDGHKMFQNCVPLNEPHSLAIAINSTYITPHFRSICVQYAPDSVQYIRTHCVEGTRFMKPNTNLEFPNRRVECLFDQNIQTLRKLIIRKKLRRICRHKKDTKLENNVHYICRQNAYFPDYCVGANATNGSEIRLQIGAHQSDGFNYIFECKLIKVAITNATTSATLSLSRSKKKKKALPNKVVLGPIRCIHHFNSSSLPVTIEIGHQLEFPEGNAVVHCLNNSGWARKLIIPKVPEVSADCLLLFGQNLYVCHGFIYRWSLTSQIELVGCVDPSNLLNWISLGKNHTINNDILECRKEGLIYLGCKSSSGKQLKIGESEGNISNGSNGLFEKCEEGIGLIKYHETHCKFGDTIILPGHFFIVPIGGANLKLRLFCEQERLSLGNNLKDNLNHRAFWFITRHRDCIDSYGNIIPLGGFLYFKNHQNIVTAEFCIPNGIQIEKPIGCKFGSINLKPTEQLVNSLDILQCFPNGRIYKIGCFFEPKNISMTLGQIEPLPDNNNNLLIHCEVNSTGISFKNGVKNCIKEETGEEFPFGSTDEDSDSIRTCTRKIEPELHGAWELTHCLFGTIKVPRGSCFFNITKEENNKTTCNLNKEEVKGIYKLCEQDENSKPIFLNASYEYCSPSQNIKATDQYGQILDTRVEKIKKESFECNSDWRPKPLPIELEKASEEEEMNDEYIDEYSDEEELKTAEEIEEKEEKNKLKEDPLKQIIIQKQNIQLEEMPYKNISQQEESIPLLSEKTLLEESKLENITTSTIATLLKANKLEKLTTETNLIPTTTEENKLENLIEINIEKSKLENLTPTTTIETTFEEKSKLEDLIIAEEEENKLETKLQNKLETNISNLNNFSTTQTNLINNNNKPILSNQTIEEFTEEIIEEFVTIETTTDLPQPSKKLFENKTEEKNLNQTTNTSSVLISSFDEEIISEHVELTTFEPSLLLSAQKTIIINKTELFDNQELSASSNYFKLNASEENIENIPEVTKVLSFTKIEPVSIVRPAPAPPILNYNEAIELLLQVNLEKTITSKVSTTKVFECRNRLSEHFCSAFKSMCLFPTGDSAIQSVTLFHTIRYLRNFIGGNNMKSNLHFAINFLNTGMAAKTPIDKQQISKMIYKIGGLLNIFSSEDDLAELLLSAEGGPIIERMLELKRASAYQCGLSRLDCNLPSDAAVNSFFALRCKKKWQTCIRVADSKLAKEFEILLWNFRLQLVSYPHGAIWVLCAKTCGHCLPLAISDGLIDSWNESPTNSQESGK